jgi:hypothetical protein
MLRRLMSGQRPSVSGAPFPVLGEPTFQQALPREYFREAIDRLSQALQVCRVKQRFRIFLYTRRPELFCEDLVFDNNGVVETVGLASTESDLLSEKSKFDVAIICQHLGLEHRVQFIVRGKQIAPLIVSWAWDNHLDPHSNLNFNALADVVIPSHRFCANTLKTPHLLLGKSVAHCTSQWSRNFTRKVIYGQPPQSRANALYGGYVLWPIGNRTELLYSIKNEVPENAIRLIDHKNREAYFRRTPEDRFAEWTYYKVSLAIPLANDLSQRVFDALIAGQIPIVPDSCHDLDYVVPPEIQNTLPIVRIREVSPPAILEAWHQALREFDRMGIEGIRSRHAFALEHHHISRRIAQIARYLQEIAANEHRIGVKIDERGVGLVDTVAWPD